ncbi:MAG TPA: hypothetical protein VJ714_06300, partial [Anaerolineae bacterium]|nr:hypothetical protein [Anaerolineae bacterium]
ATPRGPENELLDPGPLENGYKSVAGLMAEGACQLVEGIGEDPEQVHLLEAVPNGYAMGRRATGRLRHARYRVSTRQTCRMVQWWMSLSLPLR